MKLSLSICFIFTVGLFFSQKDFNNYKALISKGEINKDLSFSTYEKIQIQLDNIKKMIKIKENRNLLNVETGISYCF